MLFLMCHYACKEEDTTVKTELEPIGPRSVFAVASFSFVVFICSKGMSIIENLALDERLQISDN